MSVKKVATRNVVTLLADATIHEAAKKMREFHVGDVVIVESVDGKTRPVGILTDRDIVMATTAFGIAPDAVSVADVMFPALATAKVTDSFYHVLNLMKEHGVRRILLVDAEGSLEGIVSSEDIIAILASELGDVVKIAERQHGVEIERRIFNYFPPAAAKTGSKPRA